MTTWASENKSVVYTIAGVTIVVTGAGIVYYISSSSQSPAPGEKRKSKKDRRKEKKKAEESKQAGITLKDEESSLWPFQSQFQLAK